MGESWLTTVANIAGPTECPDGLTRQTTIAHGVFSPWEGCKEVRSTLQNTIWVIFVAE